MPEETLTRFQRYYRKHREQRLAERKAYCLTHKDDPEKRSEWSSNYYQNHKAEVLERNKLWKDNNKEYISKQNRNKRQELKLEVLTHYGCKCALCNISDPAMLCIDHVNNDGKEHRKEVWGDQIYKWLKDNNYPEGFQVLCANHNHLKELERRRETLVQSPSAIYNREYTKKYRDDILHHYGKACSCCGNTDTEILCFDHIDGGGKQHRIKNKTSHMYRWIKKNNYPEGFQILCFNCNLKKYVEKESLK